MSEETTQEPQHCPNCPDQGWYPVWDHFSGEPMQEQCEFCYTVENSVFNLNNPPKSS